MPAQERRFDTEETNTTWLNVTNVILGLLTLSLLVGIAVATIYEIIARRHRRRVAQAGLDDEMRRLFHPPHS